MVTPGPTIMDHYNTNDLLSASYFLSPIRGGHYSVNKHALVLRVKPVFCPNFLDPISGYMMPTKIKIEIL